MEIFGASVQKKDKSTVGIFGGSDLFKKELWGCLVGVPFLKTAQCSFVGGSHI